MKKLLSSFLSSGWTVHVHTADIPSAGTDSNVTIKLFGEDGEVSGDIQLDNRFRDDFERGAVDTFNIANKHVEAFTQSTRVTKIEFWMSNFGLSPDWNIDKIIVENRCQMDLFAADMNGSKKDTVFVFPVFRWIKSERRYKLCLYDTSLPQNDTFSWQRSIELEESRQEYEYCQLMKDRGLETVHCKTLPHEEMLSSDVKFKLMSESIQGILSAKMTTLLAPKTWDNIESIKEIFLQTNNPIPEGVLDWTDDVHFGLQRLAGCNNELIELMHEIPANFPVTDELLQPVFGNMTICEAIEQRRLFLCDYKILQGVKPKDGFIQSVPISLFFIDRNENLKPVAIQLFQDPGPENPIFTPCDPLHTWNFVKMWLNNADAAYHESVVHLGGTHIIMEGVVVNTHRNLSRSHPVFKLLAPHFIDTLPINSRDLPKLLGKGQLLDTFMNLGSDGILKVINKHAHSWRLDINGTLPEDLKRRSVADPNILPGYHFRNDALLVYDVISDYVKEYVDLYYTYTELLKGDTELQKWAGDLVRPTGDINPGVGLKGVPGNGELTSTDQLCQILTSIISTCSVTHAAAHSKQYEQYAFPLNCPIYLAGSPPNSKTNPVTEDDILASLPDRRNTMEMINTLKTLSLMRTKPLGDFEVQYTMDPPAVEVVERFRQRLREVSATIKTRNLTRTTAYDTLDPDNIPNSISN